jgi:hypothetical protein
VRWFDLFSVFAFGNDDAADRAAELLETSQPAEFVGKTLQLASHSGYLEAPEGSQLVAAAAVIAAACGVTPQGFPEELREWIRGKDLSLKRLAPAALVSIRRVLSEDSELRDLWQESDDFSAWPENVNVIAAAVS